MQPVIALVGVSWFAYVWWGHWTDVTPAAWIATVVAVGGAIVAAIPRGPRLGVAVAILVGLAGFAIARVVGRWPFEWDAMPDARYAAFVAATTLVAAVGIAFHAWWARWIGLALAGATALGGLLNAILLEAPRDEGGWLAAIGLIGSATVIVQLLRAGDRFHRDDLWTARDPVVTWTRRATITCFAAGAMLVLYALGQPVAEPTVTPALLLAPFLFAGAGLVVARRSIGIAILALGGIALVVQTVATLDYATDRGIAAYYAAFWLPAAACALVAGIVALRRA